MSSATSAEQNSEAKPDVSQTIDKSTGRYQFRYQGNIVYEWDQTVDEVNVYVKLPPGVPANALECSISPTKVTVGIKGNPPYMDEPLFAPIKDSESYWTIEDGELHLTLAKMANARPWDAVSTRFPVLDVQQQEEVRKSIMRERFALENPGFDFSNAEFSGQVPDPEHFMRDLDK